MKETYFDYQVSPEKVFSLNLIDLKRGVRVKVELQDENNEVFPLYQIAEELIKYIDNEVTRDESILVKQIYPLMSQLLISGLGRLFGIEATGYMLNNELIKTSLIEMMSLSFILLKYMQQKKLTMVTTTEPISEGDKQMLILRSQKIAHQNTISGFIGMNPKDILKELYQNGELTESDLESFMQERIDDSKNVGSN